MDPIDEATDPRIPPGRFQGVVGQLGQFGDPPDPERNALHRATWMFEAAGKGRAQT